MKDFDYIYKDMKYRVKPWDKLRLEEQSFIIYQAYRKNILETQDMHSFVFKKSLRCATHLAFPMLFYKYALSYVKANPNVLRFRNGKYVQAATVLSTMAAWWLFSLVNPLKYLHRAEKTKILQYIDNQVGYRMVKLNRQLPRTFYENRVDRFTVGLYMKRNNFLSGILFEKEYYGVDKVDSQEYFSGKNFLAQLNLNNLQWEKNKHNNQFMYMNNILIRNLILKMNFNFKREYNIKNLVEQIYLYIQKLEKLYLENKKYFLKRLKLFMLLIFQRNFNQLEVIMYQHQKIIL